MEELLKDAHNGKYQQICNIRQCTHIHKKTQNKLRAKDLRKKARSTNMAGKDILITQNICKQILK